MASKFYLVKCVRGEMTKGSETTRDETSLGAKRLGKEVVWGRINLELIKRHPFIHIIIIVNHGKSFK